MPYTLPDQFWMPRQTQGKPYVTTGALAAPPYVHCVQVDAIKPPPFTSQTWDELEELHGSDDLEESLKMLIEWAQKVREVLG